MFVPFLIFPNIYFNPDVLQEREDAAREHEKSLENKDPATKSKKEEQENYDEESMVGVEEKEEVFLNEEHIPGRWCSDVIQILGCFLVRQIPPLKKYSFGCGKKRAGNC